MSSLEKVSIPALQNESLLITVRVVAVSPAKKPIANRWSWTILGRSIVVSKVIVARAVAYCRQQDIIANIHRKHYKTLIWLTRHPPLLGEPSLRLGRADDPYSRLPLSHRRYMASPIHPSRSRDQQSQRRFRCQVETATILEPDPYAAVLLCIGKMLGRCCAAV